MEKMFSSKGKTLIVLNNFKYRFDHKLKSSYEESWRCSVKSCGGALFTVEDGSVFSRLGKEHNHEPHAERNLNRQRINNAVKRKAVENIDEVPAKLIRREIAEQKASVLTRHDMTLIKNSICKERQKALPKFPKSSAKVSFSKFYLIWFTKLRLLLFYIC